MTASGIEEEVTVAFINFKLMFQSVCHNFLTPEGVAISISASTRVKLKLFIVIKMLFVVAEFAAHGALPFPSLSECWWLCGSLYLLFVWGVVSAGSGMWFI